MDKKFCDKCGREIRTDVDEGRLFQLLSIITLKPKMKALELCYKCADKLKRFIDETLVADA